VGLTTVNAYGANTNTKADYITVAPPPPAANFSGTPTHGAAPLTMNFTNSSTGVYTNSAWTFGDGGSLTNTGTTASYLYTTPGTYTVNLIVNGPGGSATNMWADYIVVTNPPPAAGFSGTPTSGPPPLLVTFTNTSTWSYTNSEWTFGDGGSLTNTGTTASYTYNNLGTYTVELIVNGPDGSATNTRANYIVVALLPTVGIASGPDGITITFTGTLQAADRVLGPWTNVIGATSPLFISNPQGRAFYRAIQ